MPTRPIWEGNISFGLVNIPISLFSAVAYSKTLKFNYLHKKDSTPIKYQKYCPSEQKPVPWEEIIRAYKYAKDKFVEVSQDDFEKADPKLTHSIDVLDFVDLGEIPAIFFETPYYLIPKTEAAKSYQVFNKALREENKVGIAKVVIKTKEYLAAIIPYDGGLVLETMLFNHEIKKLNEFELPAKKEISEKEIELAKQIINSLSSKFEPEKYKDSYHAKILAIIRKKAKGEKIVTPEKEKVKEVEYKDLLAQLRASMDEIEKSKKR